MGERVYTGLGLGAAFRWFGDMMSPINASHIKIERNGVMVPADQVMDKPFDDSGDPSIEAKEEITVEVEKSPGDIPVTKPEKSFSFPEEATKYDYISYTARSYSKPRRDESMIIRLPMPAELNEQLEAGWTAQDDWLKATKDLGTTASDALHQEFTQGNGKQGLWEAGTGVALAKFGGTGAIQKTNERRSGRVINPVSEQFFTGMSHRTWEFMHKIVAETLMENNSI